MNKEEIKKTHEIVMQFVTFRTAIQIVGLVSWTYYYIFIYKITGSIELVIFEKLFHDIGTWVGFTIGSFVVDRIGYLTTFRISALMQMLTFILIAVLLNNLQEFIVLLAFIRGVARGPFWSTSHIVVLKETHNQKRAELINSLISIFMIFGIIIPPLVGGYLSYTNDYSFIFLLSAVVCFISIIYPFKYNKKPRSKITAQEITKILKHKDFPKFAFAAFIHDGVMSLINNLFLLIPFLLISDEFGVGILGSVVALTAAIFGFLERKKDVKLRITFGYIGFFVFFVVHFILGMLWTLPMLILRSLGQPFTDTMGESVRADLDYRYRESLIEKNLEESSTEMGLIIDTIYLFDRVIVSMFIIFILNFFKESQIDVIRIILIVTSFLPLIAFKIYTNHLKQFENTKVRKIGVLTSKHQSLH